MGLLIIVGGPGGSGSSTIARMLAKELGLHYVYGGKYMREYASQYGFDQIADFLRSKEYIEMNGEIDKIVDSKLISASRWHDVLIDSKSFAALATFMQIPSTIRIWLDARLETRVRRTLHKEGILDLKKKLSKKSKIYLDLERSLKDRYELDKERFRKLYDIDYDSPQKYNDIVIDTSAYNAGQTFNLIMKVIGDVRSDSTNSSSINRSIRS